MNRSKNLPSRGFTVIELLVVIAVISTACVLFFIQKNSLESANRDEKRKIADNAIYYNLEEVFYPKNGYYPATIDKETLTAVDPDLLKDTSGVEPNQTVNIEGLTAEENALAGQQLQANYEYRYEPTNCDTTGKCKSYSIRVQLDNEAEYTKKSRRS